MICAKKVTCAFDRCALASDNRAGTACVEFREKPIGVEWPCPPREHRRARYRSATLRSSCRGPDLEKEQIGQVFESVDQSNDRGGQSGARESNGLISNPPLCAARLLVIPNNCAADHCVFEIGGTADFLEIRSNTPSSTNLRSCSSIHSSL